MSPPGDLAAFYEEAYRASPEEAARGSRWRALGARAKADHVELLLKRAGSAPTRVAEVGCGDGALLLELSRRGIGAELAGYEVSRPAVEIVRERAIPRLVSVEAFDGVTLPVADRAFDLGILSHVLEHVPAPAALLAETARACRSVVVEVPLEANLSARRPSKRAGAEDIGHLQRLDRSAVLALVKEAGLRVVSEELDPLGREAHLFFADGPAGRARAAVKAAVRRAVFVVSPALAQRLFTLHHALLCAPYRTASAA